MVTYLWVATIRVAKYNKKCAYILKRVCKKGAQREGGPKSAVRNKGEITFTRKGKRDFQGFLFLSVFAFESLKVLYVAPVTTPRFRNRHNLSLRTLEILDLGKSQITPSVIEN